MNLKEELLKIKKVLVGEEQEETTNYFKGIIDVNLDSKVDTFIDWYYENMVKGKYTNVQQFHMPNEMRNFIEKMAVWYELRYPDYEINRLMPCSYGDRTYINDVMFNSNKYINELFDENADIRALDWDKFYNIKAFINSLPWIERHLFYKKRYADVVFIAPFYDNGKAHLHLTSRGFVMNSECVESYTNFKVTDKEIKGMHIKDVLKLLKEKGIELPSDNELEKAIKDYENWNYQKEEMLNCVMYRIIERGGNRYGPRRGFLFAKEFGRNIDIPMMYGVDYSDPGLRSFVNEYIKAGGSKDLMCYVGYFSRANESKEMDKISISDLLKKLTDKYTIEEKELHQRMVNALVSQVDEEQVRKEEINQLRLQRKLNGRKNMRS